MPVKLEGFSGGDRTAIDLPTVQEELLKAVAAIGKPLVVVLENGSALAVNWAQEHANAILEAWYPGEEGGTSIAETLAGDNNPAGRLPLTFYSSLSQAPPLTTTPWKAAPTVTSPTNRSIASASVSATLTHLQQHQAPLLKYQSRRPVTIEGDVKNTASVAGDEVVELYLTQPKASDTPIRVLAGFIAFLLTRTIGIWRRRRLGAGNEAAPVPRAESTTIRRLISF